MEEDKNKSYEEVWPAVEPTLVRMVNQETVAPADWHTLFDSVHTICRNDRSGPSKLYESIQKEMKAAANVSITAS